MATTNARRARRRAERVVNGVVQQVLEQYSTDPNAALKICFSYFGKEHFENVLKKYIHKNLARVAYVLAIKECIQNGKGEVNA